MHFQYFILFIYSELFFIDNVSGQQKIFQRCGYSQPFKAVLTNAPWISRREYNAKVNGCIQNQNIVKITLSGELNVVEAETFINLPELTRIDMTNSNVQLLKANFFKETPKLQEVLVGNNRMTTIRKGVFTNRSLGELYLDSNLINSIQDDAFENLDVQVLDLSHNYLAEVKNTWFANTTIVSLSFNHNKIIYLNKNGFEGIRNLRFIYLNYNGMMYIEDGTFSGQRNLWRLHLAGNVLTDLEFLSDVNLRLLDVGFNEISDVAINNTTEIKEMHVFPNPWDCKRLRRFWKKAFQKQMKFGYSNARSHEWDDRKPICLMRRRCEENHCQNELYNSYFNIVNYAQFGSYHTLNYPGAIYNDHI